jgi:hypothetical protein
MFPDIGRWKGRSVIFGWRTRLTDIASIVGFFTLSRGANIRMPYAIHPVNEWINASVLSSFLRFSIRIYDVSYTHTSIIICAIFLTTFQSHRPIR